MPILRVLRGSHHSANTDLVMEVIAVVPRLTTKGVTLRSVRSGVSYWIGMMTL